MKAQRKESKEQFNAKIAALEKEKDLVTTNLGQYERNIKKMDEELSRLSLVETNMQAKASTISRETGDEVPRTKHLLSLYRSISNIQWRHDSDFIEGRMCPVRSRVLTHHTYTFLSSDVTLVDDVRPFSFDPTKHPKVVVADQLWDLLA
jgi:hypothetical protein